jgi:hypothetical protein
MAEMLPALTHKAPETPSGRNDILGVSGSGGIGRRASLRSWWPKGRRGSSPFFRTNVSCQQTRSHVFAGASRAIVPHAARARNGSGLIRRSRLLVLHLKLVHHLLDVGYS